MKLAVPSRRFPPPWSVEELDACYVVKDGSGQKVAFVYYEDEPGQRSAAKLLSKDEARRIAANIAKLPELIAAAVIRSVELIVQPDRK
jgi:hypothetical protein